MDIVDRRQSEDGSIKYLFILDDGNTIESLYMCDKNYELTYHSTLCVSSQVGCKLGCAFCATGKQGFVRNLTDEEIVEQVLLCNNFNLKSGLLPLDAVVFAGMGEPLLNYPNVKSAINKIYLKLGIRSFELATVGVVPRIYDMIRDFTNSPVNIRLNLSLHATTDILRKKLIPFSTEYGINTIIKAAEDYSRSFKCKSRIRYTLFNGLNNFQEDIERVYELLENKPLKLVVSQYNDNNVPGLAPTTFSDVTEFCEKISKRLECDVFHSFGNDIKGGCGQLRQSHM